MIDKMVYADDNRDLINEFLGKNREYFDRRSVRANSSNGLVLVDLQTTDAYFATSMMKVAAATSEALGGNMMVLGAVRTSKKINAIVESYCPTRVVNIMRIMLSGLIRRFGSVIRLTILARDGDALTQIRIGDCSVGIHIYDLLLRRSGKPKIGKFTKGERLQIFVELAFFYGCMRMVERENYHFFILPDNCYRSGLLFEIGKSKGIPSIAAIDLNGLSIHKYDSQNYEHHCRAPDSDVVNAIMAFPDALAKAEEYCELRTSAKLQQHDVIRAYASAKHHITKEQIISTSGWDQTRKVVVVMAHVFCDAPHSAPNLLFTDYEDWLIQTCRALSRNENVYYFVKEHPSASLYNEEGVTEHFLKLHGFGDRVLPPHVNTKSLFDWADVVITCGGTAAMEFPCHGIPVLVAAEPPNYFESYIVQAKTRAQYFSELERIHEYRKLTDADRKRAKAILYLVHDVMTVKGSEIGLGSQGLPFGAKVDCHQLYREMIRDLSQGTGYRKLLDTMKAFLFGTHKNLMDYRKLEACFQNKSPIM